MIALSRDIEGGYKYSGTANKRVSETTGDSPALTEEIGEEWIRGSDC